MSLLSTYSSHPFGFKRESTRTFKINGAGSMYDDYTVEYDINKANFTKTKKKALKEKDDNFCAKLDIKVFGKKQKLKSR